MTPEPLRYGRAKLTTILADFDSLRAAIFPAPVEGLLAAAQDIVNDHDAGNWSEYKVEALRAALSAYGERGYG
ncbi:hypothetical protein [Limimaricola hongkongensis]|uniref:Uncharacterized protein n=1 Tax=Limimaricola hongkongensis DSM 17492 TaxID=1122180 RepID=A0A017HDF3_9RHOB|nr:hypothetical protein [Limimaricola hongkongensis]EYD71829.1 hypothetical protein Lokhon_01899 [Limimaricola hongkongensis DSM 17492]